MKNLYPKNYRQQDIEQIIAYIKKRNKIMVFYLNGVGKNPFFKKVGWELTQKLPEDLVINAYVNSKEDLIQMLAAKLEAADSSVTSILEKIDTIPAEKNLILNVQIDYLENNPDTINLLAYINELRKHNSFQVIPVIHLYWTSSLSNIIDKPNSLDIFKGIRVYHKSFTIDNFGEALHYFESKNRSLFPKEKEIFWEISAGLPRIYKQTYLFANENNLRINQDNFIRKFKTSQRFQRYLQQLRNDLGNIKSNIKTLNKFGLINNKGTPKSTLLDGLINIDYRHKLLNPEIFTKSELKILAILLENELSTISKEKIAKLLWGILIQKRTGQQP